METRLRWHTIVLSGIPNDERASVLLRWRALLRLIISGRCGIVRSTSTSCTGARVLMLVACLRIDPIRLAQSLLLVAYVCVSATTAERRWLVAWILATVRGGANLALVTLKGLLLLGQLQLFEFLVLLRVLGRLPSFVREFVIKLWSAWLVKWVEGGIALVDYLDGHPNWLFLRGGLVVFRSRRGHPWVKRRLWIVKFYHCIVFLQLIDWRGHCVRWLTHLFAFFKFFTT